MIKETMDKKFGAPWHVVAGGYFSYDITFEVHDNIVLRCLCLLQAYIYMMLCAYSARICCISSLGELLVCFCGRCNTVTAPVYNKDQGV